MNGETRVPLIRGILRDGDGLCAGESLDGLSNFGEAGVDPDGPLIALEGGGEIVLMDNLPVHKVAGVFQSDHDLIVIESLTNLPSENLGLYVKDSPFLEAAIIARHVVDRAGVINWVE